MTANEPKKDAYFWFAFSIALLSHFLLIFLVRLYPFVDLPNHLAEATIFRFYGEPGNQFAQYFSLKLFPSPNIFHIVFFASRIFPTVEFGCKVFYALYVISLPLSIVLVINKLKGNRWFAFLSFLFLYNFNCCWGFSGFTIFLPYFFVLFYVTLEYLDNDCLRNKIILALLLLLAHFIHLVGALFCLLVICTVITCAFRASLADMLKKNMVCVPLICMMSWYLIDSHGQVSSHGLAFLKNYYARDYLNDLMNRSLQFFVRDNHFLFAGAAGVRVACLFSLFVLFYICASCCPFKKGFLSHAEAWPVSLLALCALFCYFALPHRLPSVFFIYERFSSIAFLSIIILAGVICRRNTGFAMKASLCIICSVHFFLWATCFVAFEKENRNFTRDFFPADTVNKRLTGLIYDNSFRRFNAYIHFQNYYTIWRQGIAATKIVEYSCYSALRHGGSGSLPDYDEWVGRGRNKKFNPACYDVDYILVRGAAPADCDEYLNKYFKVSRSERKWLLYGR
jgi:hypothetical protein